MKLIKDLGMLFPTESSKEKKRLGIYECPECLEHFRTHTSNVLRGKTKQCKQCRTKVTTISRTSHGLSGHKLYQVWCCEKARCYNTNDRNYCDYGGRGVSVSEEFSDFTIWLEYVETLPNAYRDKYSIDRIDNDKGYERGNLRWASRSIQAQNTRVLRKDNKSGYRGVSWDSLAKSWMVVIGIDGKQKYLGRTKTAMSGAMIYDNYVIENNLEHTVNGI